MDTREILERLYPELRPAKRRRRLRHRMRRWLRERQERLGDWVAEHDVRLALGSIVVAAWVVGHIYYHNRLISLQFDVHAAQAQIEAAQQKRNHISRSIRRLLLFYERYERTLMTEVTGIRAAEPGASQSAAGEAAPLDGLLGRLNAVAEQYPSLRLTETVQSLSEAVIASESEVALRIADYNGAVNTYTTELRSFPGNLFAEVAGFEWIDFYEAEDPSVLEYTEPDL